jgi:hypothetical protein
MVDSNALFAGADVEVAGSVLSDDGRLRTPSGLMTGPAAPMDGTPA